MMNNERELLELAAKAAGHEIEWRVGWDGTEIPRPMVGCKDWNPLTDDGDALRLAIRLGMTIEQWACHVEIRIGADVIHRELSNGTTTREQLTCRAIVRAAAEIGKNIP